MDYSLKQDGFELLVEAEKERVKEEILSSYINLRKKKGITQQQIADLTGMQGRILLGLRVDVIHHQ